MALPARADLSVSHPALAAQADGWDPTTVTSGTTRKLAWRCSLGHRWEAQVGSRARGAGCPVCANRQVLAGYNDLATTHPELASQADGWDPATVTAGTTCKLAWRCGSGHRWDAKAANRVRGTGCPVCANRQVLAGFNDLATTHPDLATQADGWDPTTVTAGSERKLAWRCGSGHRWDATVVGRTRGAGCPVCGNRQVLAGFNDLATTHPELASQADGWDPSTLTAGAKAHRTWVCPSGHQWQARVSSRASGMGCPVCANRDVAVGCNDLATTHPDLAAQADGWDPTTVAAGTKRKLAWQCGLGHRWEALVSTRSAGRGCPVCANRQVLAGHNDLATTHPDLAAQADGWDPTTVVAGSERKLAWRCGAGHCWDAPVAQRSRPGGSGCPVCAPRGFDPSRPSCVYVVESDAHDFYKFGIANLPLQRRLTQHERNWGAKLRWSHPTSGATAQRAEALVRAWKRDSGLPRGVEKGDGHTETVARALVDLEELVGVCVEALGRVQGPTPPG